MGSRQPPHGMSRVTRRQAIEGRPLRGGQGSAGALHGGTVTARFDGRCSMCGGPIRRGDTIAPSGQSGRFAHLACPRVHERSTQ